MSYNKNSLTCSSCHKYFAEDNLINTAKGFYCEDCYAEHEVSEN